MGVICSQVYEDPIVGVSPFFWGRSTSLVSGLAQPDGANLWGISIAESFVDSQEYSLALVLLVLCGSSTSIFRFELDLRSGPHTRSRSGSLGAWVCTVTRLCRELGTFWKILEILEPFDVHNCAYMSEVYQWMEEFPPKNLAQIWFRAYSIVDVPRFVDQSIGANQHGSSKDICSLFDSYLPNLEASTHEITWRMFSTQLRNSSNKNQIKWSSDERVMQFTKPVIFSSREFGPYVSSSPRLDPYHHGPERPE
ncbi:hypothetical protein DY000_02058639 [Brassica cretica]|uniref:Uncharacterized protein n=1 Tax=Brassica cretica TaxID=69181 RepID=A0ABQ7B2K5_BRACR|nr:hypothetical protein DY000_02058639 [Brassica cretica]